MIWTSYFGRLKHLGSAGLTESCVPICRHYQRWVPGPLRRRGYKALAPPADLLKAYKKGWTTWEKFEAAYVREVLDRLDPAEVIDDLRALGGPEPILMCYCKGDEGQCHRFAVGRWLASVDKVREWSALPDQSELV